MIEFQHSWYTVTSTLKLNSTWHGSGRACCTAHVCLHRPATPWKHWTTWVILSSTLRFRMESCHGGLPNRTEISPELEPYWSARRKLTISEDIHLHRSCLVVYLQMQSETLRKIHQGHQGILSDIWLCQPMFHEENFWSHNSSQLPMAESSDQSVPTACKES